ncbi:hypothetical protein RIF29_45477 [Crotalaria pallida]|uniref:Uncharacterized protein n=1 Tax=Crotalaria pallida TaxID=3830 RepID=A0AAN9DTI3_CROPI
MAPQISFPLGATPRRKKGLIRASLVLFFIIDHVCSIPSAKDRFLRAQTFNFDSLEKSAFFRCGPRVN